MKFYQTNWFLKIISVLIAIVLWIYVVYEQNPSYEKWVRDIPIIYQNTVQEFENGKLVMMDQNSATVDIKIRGKRRLISSINNTNVTAAVDMLGVTRDGNYSLPISVNFAPDGIEILQKRPYNAQIIVDRVVTEEREIETDTRGALKSGYLLDEGKISPSVIQLTGPQSLVNQVTRCSIGVDLTDSTETIKGLYKIKLYNASNNEVTDTRLSKNMEYTEVNYNIVATKTVPITPVLSAQANLRGKTITASPVSAQTVVIKGQEEVLAGISEVKTESVDVSQINENTQLEAELVLPEGVSLVDEQPQEIAMMLTIEENADQED